MNLFERLNQEILISDGAMGTMLQASGLPTGSPPEIWNLTHPEKIKAVHKAYINAGAKIITTNTFGANTTKLKEYGLHKAIKSINQKAVELARAAANAETIVAGSIGPTGKFLIPFGELSFNDAYKIFREQAVCLHGVDIIMIETMIDTLELRAAVIGAKDAIESDIPIIAQFSFNEGTRTVTGTDASTACAIFDSLGVPIFGANCGSTLADALEVLKQMGEAIVCTGSGSPYLIIQPNAGIGENIVPPTEFADFAVKFVGLGANIVGSCCGSTPEHTKHIAHAINYMKPIRRGVQLKATTSISSRTQIAYIGDSARFLVVGERINPSGKPKLKAEMRARKTGYIKSEAIKQVELGAKALDINIGAEPKELMTLLIQELQKTTQVPLFIDSQDPVTIEEALKVYGGKGVINSVNGREDICNKILPVAKRYGAAVIGLTINEHGIPESAQERLKIAKKIIKLAISHKIRRSDIIIDPLVIPIGTHERGADITIESLRRIKKELGVPTILGISNISFGLPGREFLNQAFLVSAIQAGLDAAILDPYEPRVMELISASELLAARDSKGGRYISRFISPPVASSDAGLHPLKKAVLAANKDEIPEHIDELLKSGLPPLKIINEFLIPAIEEAGERYERKELFLPHLIGAAEAMKEGISILAHLFGKEKRRGKKIILATVEGDMHDLGKNLLAMILEANGYEVIDLGKDVKPARIIEVSKKESPDIVGLSCLMTTTLPSLETTVKYLKKEWTGKIIVGGASVDKKFATQIGASYAKDAIETVKLLKTLL